MSSFLDRMLGRGSKGSGATAKDRLQLVLIHDRINLSPERMQEMKEEILAVISKYMTIDRDSVDIALEQQDRNNSKIVAEIPVSPGRRTKLDLAVDLDNDDLPHKTDVKASSEPVESIVPITEETTAEEATAEEATPEEATAEAKVSSPVAEHASTTQSTEDSAEEDAEEKKEDDLTAEDDRKSS